jgi:hypothetical protein
MGVLNVSFLRVVFVFLFAIVVCSNGALVNKRRVGRYRRARSASSSTESQVLSTTAAPVSSEEDVGEVGETNIRGAETAPKATDPAGVGEKEVNNDPYDSKPNEAELKGKIAAEEDGSTTSSPSVEGGGKDAKPKSKPDEDNAPEENINKGIAAEEKANVRQPTAGTEAAEPDKKDSDNKEEEPQSIKGASGTVDVGKGQAADDESTGRKPARKETSVDLFGPRLRTGNEKVLGDGVQAIPAQDQKTAMELLYKESDDEPLVDTALENVFQLKGSNPTKLNRGGIAEKQRLKNKPPFPEQILQ